MPKTKGESLNQHNPNLSITVNMSNSSVSLNSNAQTYSQYVRDFEDKHCQIEYQGSSESTLQKSLDEMRIVLREFNVLLNKMMDKNYELLADKELVVADPNKDIQILKAQLDNARKMIANQQSQIHNLHAIEKEMMGKGKQGYEQMLLDQIAEVKAKMPKIELDAKHNACDINRNGYTLVNQEVDNTLYLRVNIMRGDLDRAYERWRKAEEKDKEVEARLKEFEEKSYQITAKMDEAMQLAKSKSIEVTASGNVVSLQKKYDQLKKKRQQQKKKNLLLEHVSQTNEANLVKKINDMKRLLSEYHNKHEIVARRIDDLEKSNQDILGKSNVMGDLTQRSMSYMYAQTLLKGDRKKGASPEKADIDDSILKQGQKKHYVKPHFQKRIIQNKGLGLSGQERYGKSLSKQQINSSKKNAIIHFQNEQKNEKNANKSHIFNIRKKNNHTQQKNVKHWKKDEQQENKNKYKSEQKVDLVLSKPKMRLKRRQNIQRSEDFDFDFSDEDKKQGVKNGQKKVNKMRQSKMSEEYMTYLEQKGRKILGI